MHCTVKVYKRLRTLTDTGKSKHAIMHPSLNKTDQGALNGETNTPLYMHSGKTDQVNTALCMCVHESVEQVSFLNANTALVKVSVQAPMQTAKHAAHCE